ncbi:MAG: hypothetical protein GEU73_12570 [Chloroflexi bacterium]|nr:hypothetical protein [Chloroflexota bacterium]
MAAAVIFASTVLFASSVVSVSFPGAEVIQAQEDRGSNAKRGNNAFDIALIGDTRYTTEQQAKFPNLLSDINRQRIAFVVHDGDIKGGSNACTDSIYTETRDLFDEFEAPFIYTPGDNEWTDCHRAGGDPIERLAFLREIFYPNGLSLGQDKLRLDRQSKDYPENALWTYGRVTFATLHVVGSNNNLGRAPEADEEYAARNAANLQWIASTFAEARASRSIGVMLIMQANPFDGDPSQRTGFADTLAAVQRETLAFDKPVVLVHGDSHYFRIDKPMLGSASGRRIEKLTRVETFGTDDVHWVRATIDPQEPEVFVFRQEIVDANLVDH